MKHVAFGGRLVMVGCGSIGQGVLPLILRHIDMPPGADHHRDRRRARRGGRRRARAARASSRRSTRENYRDVLAPLLGAGDFLLNLSVDVSSVALIDFAREVGALYLDTCIEPWAGGYTDPSLTPSQRSNYALRESAIALRGSAGGPTAVLTHGANPGLVSHLLKEALLNVAARHRRCDAPAPTDARGLGAAGASGWASRRSTSPSATPRRPTAPRSRASSSTPGRSTASSARAASRPNWAGARMRRALPADARRHDFGCGAAIYLLRPGASTRVRSWTPLEGPFHGFLITHNEAISIADYYTVTRGRRAALPADRALRLPPVRRRGAVGARAGRQELAHAAAPAADDGRDHPRHRRTRRAADGPRARAPTGTARGCRSRRRARLAPHNNATSLQVTAAVLAGMVWAMENPRAGVRRGGRDRPCARSWRSAGRISARWSAPTTDWTPLQDRGAAVPGGCGHRTIPGSSAMSGWCERSPGRRPGARQGPCPCTPPGAGRPLDPLFLVRGGCGCCWALPVTALGEVRTSLGARSFIAGGS